MNRPIGIEEVWHILEASGFVRIVDRGGDPMVAEIIPSILIDPLPSEEPGGETLREQLRAVAEQDATEAEIVAMAGLQLM